ncbi:hypothetical protein FEM48_Zijuj03G0126800 [Ziziphus jujuba var. spinosa]|uniref:Chromo domain-containing protein n=1 Tax=Ziziphus jujuba var. spinosa TaxID=714518 RepID=A0A978VQD2_ZIZJJ|nr:hypothetical protein FEM48_Zijuj03G0126800 [Ziziphus jujuba var. spinosa]
MAEFAYNSSINRSTGRSPFEIVTEMLPRKPIDLVPLPLVARPSAEAETFGRHIQEIHDDIRRKIALSNESYKAHADLKRKFAEFNEGDMVMVRIRPERFPRGTYKKLHSRNVGPYKILKKISSNAYVLDLPKDMGISNVFNIEDLSSYEGHENDTARGSKAASLPSTFRLKEEIEDVVDHQIVSTRGGGYQRYLIKWKDRPLSDCTWITDQEFQKLNQDLYDQFHAINSPGSMPSLRNFSRVSRNLVLGFMGFPPATCMVFKGAFEGFSTIDVGDFWNWLESLWAWNSASYLFKG